MFGREVGDGADDLVGGLGGFGGGAHEAEVGEFDAAGGVDEYVVRFDVAVDHAFRVRDSEAGEHAAHHGRGGVRDTVRIRVTDPDENASPTSVDGVDAPSEVLQLFDQEDNRLLETDLDTGIFQLRIPTDDGAAVSQDGVFALPTTGLGLDTIVTVYTDTIDVRGGTTVFRDTTYVINLFGDTSGNNRVGAFDGAQVLRIAVGLLSADARDSLASDVSGDNDVNAFDASLVLQYVVRLIDRFPVQTDTNMVSDPKNHPFLKPVPLDHILALGEVEAVGDGSYRIPLTLMDRSGVVSGTFEIGYDLGVKVVDVSTADAFGGYMVAHNAEVASVRIAFAGTGSDLAGPGEVLWLHVKPEGDMPLRLTLDRVMINGVNLTPSFAPEVFEAVVRADQKPVTFALHQNIPNPFNPQTTIRYDVPEGSAVRLVIYNTVGQQVRTLVAQRQEAGAHQVVWDCRDAVGRDVASGIYLIRMNAGSFSQVRKMLLVR